MRLLKLCLSSLLLSGCTFERCVSINPLYQVKGIHSHVYGSDCVVLMVGGSGDVDLDYTINDIKLYSQLASALRDHHISSLRIEKRNVYETVEQEYLNDVELALNYLNGRYDHIFLLGHSLGAMIVPVFDQQVDGLVLMAGAVSEIEEIYAAQLKKDADEQQKRIIDDELDIILDLETDSGFSWFGIRESWWISMDQLHLKQNLKNLKSPVLVISAGQDEKIDRNEFELYQKMLVDHDDASFVMIEHVSHEFVNDRQQLDESVVERIASWILQHSSGIIEKRCCE